MRLYAPAAALPAPAPAHLRQLGHEVPVSESPPATSEGWARGSPTGRVLLEQSVGPGNEGYVWGVRVDASDGASVLLQPLPMRTRGVGLRLAEGDYVLSTYRQACIDDCATVAAAVQHCSMPLHVTADAVMQMRESAPTTACKLLRSPEPHDPQLASIAVRRVGTGGWQLETEGTSVALAPPVDALALWVSAGPHTLRSFAPSAPETDPCESRVVAADGESVEVVHSFSAGVCRPYRTDADLSARRPD